MTGLTLIVIIGAAVAFIMLIAGIIISVSSERSMVEERLGKYVENEAQYADIPLSNTERESVLTGWLTKQVEKSSWGDRIAKELARADLKFKPGEYLALMVIAAFGVGFLGFFLGGKSILLAIIGCIAGPFFPRMYVKSEQSKRLIRFDGQLPDMLNLMVNGLRAGYSNLQAMEAVSRELPNPIADEFRRVVQEITLGVPTDKALDNLIRRIPSDDLDLVVTAMNVQREVGGNLAEILDTISHTIRERVRIKGEIRVLTTQVMYSGKFLSMLPLFVIGILYLLNRDYMMEFFKPESVPCGYIALALGALMIFFGYLTMNKIGDIEV
jgi:tight adherence protein B